MPFITTSYGTRINVAAISHYWAVDDDDPTKGSKITIIDSDEFETRQTPAELDRLIHSAERIAAHEAALVPICRLCGCTEDRACPQGCGWDEDDPTICTACVETAELRAASPTAALMDVSRPLPRDRPRSHGRGAG